MIYSIEFTRQADADLREIFEPIAMELHSLQSGVSPEEHHVAVLL